MFYDRYVELCQQKGVSLTRAAKDNKLSNSTQTKWQEGSIPNGATLIKLANYFNVSIDYLVGLSNKKQIAKDLSDEESVLLEYFRRLNAIGRKQAIEQVKNLNFVPDFQQDTDSAVNS